MASRMRKESRSQTRGTVVKQETQTRSAETVVTPRKQSRKASSSTPVTYGASSRDIKSVGKSRSAALSGSSSSPGRSRDVKQASAADVASQNTSVSSAIIEQLQQPDADVSGAAVEKVSSARKEKTSSRTPDKGALKSRRWVRGGPIEYSTPPSDHSNDKTGNETVADKQKYSSDSRESTKRKSSSKKNIALAFDGSDMEADVKQKYKESDSVPSTSAGAKRKKNPALQGLTAVSKGSSISKGASRKNSKDSAAVKIEPETTRTKRMARLNAEAIVSLIYKHDESAARSSKFHDSSDSDVDTDSSEFNSEDEHTRVAKKNRAKTSTSQGKLARTSKNKGEGESSSPRKKRETHSTAKQSSKKSEKSPKSPPKVSSKGCKKSVEVVSSTDWSLPKRMASLNAQAIIAACSEEPAKKSKSPVHTSESLQRSAVSAPVTGDKASDDTGSREKSPHTHTGTRQTDQHKATDALSLKSTAKDCEQNAVDQEGKSSSHLLKPSLFSGSRDVQPAKHVADAVLHSSQSEARTQICESYVQMLGPPPPPPLISSSRSPSKHHSRSSQPRRRATPEGSGVLSSSPLNWQKGGTVENSRADVAVCQRQVVESQPLGFPTATRLTATVAPSPVRFNMPIIVPQVSATNYYGSRQAHHAYYPYQSQNVFTYPVGGYMPSAKPYQPSTLASWSNMQEMSQYSYQPVLAASLCPPSVGRAVQQHPQPSHMLRSYFTAQPQYQNLQPAHTSLALYPAAFGVIAPSAAVLPPSHIIDVSSQRGYEPRSFAAGEKSSVNIQSLSAVQPATSAARLSSPPAARSKHHQSGFHVATNIQPAHMPYSSAAHANRDTSMPVTSAVADRRDGSVIAGMTPVTAAAAIIQPYGFYASCPPASFGVTNFAPGQIQSLPVGCYQPAGPLIPMSSGWDPQKVGQPALQQVALASPGTAVPGDASVTCQMIISSSAASASYPHSNKICEDASQAPAISRPAAESLPVKPQKTVPQGSVEVGVGTHSADKKSSRSRSFHSSIHPSDKSRNPVGNVPIGAAHLVVADQERELDLSQKGTGYNSIGYGATVVTTHESIVKPAIGVVHDVSHATVATCSSSMSQIGHLERFVRGLVTSGSGSPVRQAPQIVSLASNSSQTENLPHDFSITPPKRKPDQLEDVADERQSVSPKRTKYSAADEGCSSEVQVSFSHEVQSSCINTEDSNVVMDSLQSGGDASVDATVKQNSDLDKDTNSVLSHTTVKQNSDLDKHTNSALSLPDIVTAPLQSSEDQEMPRGIVEVVNQPIEIEESSESFELVSDDASSNAAVPTSSEKNHLPSLSNETTEAELVGNPKSKDTAGSNPTKVAAAGTAESKQRTSPVCSKSMTELNKKRTQTSASVQEKRWPRVAALPAEKTGKRSADEGPSRNTSARRKRDTGGWEWYGDPERKPVYFKADMPSTEQLCYPAIQHADGDIIRARDCVLVKSGMRKKDIPYVAKIDCLWKHPDTDEMLMSVLWYYRLEHTGTAPLPRYIDREVFASRHRDVIPVKCIEDRCYVLTLNEFNRYKAELKRRQSGAEERQSFVPESSEPVSQNESSHLPDIIVDPDVVFLCRYVYDVKLHRILKNPPAHPVLM